MIMANKGIPALLAESGQYGIYDPVHAETHFHGLKNVLSSIGILNIPMDKRNKQLHIAYKGSMRSPLNGLWYPCKSTGDNIKAGEYIGKITDYFGETIHEVIAPYDAKVVALRRNLYVNMGRAMYYLAETGDK